MALQGTSGIAQILSQGFIQSSFRTSLSSFLQAQSQLGRENFDPGRFRVEQGLRSRLVNLNAVTDVDALQRARIDVARSSLESVDSTLTELSSLAASAVGADAATRASLDASAQSLIASIASTLGAATRDDSELLIRTDISGVTGVSSVSVDRLSTNIADGGVALALNITNSGTKGRIANAIRTDSVDGGTLANDTDILVNGALGSATFNFASGTSTSQIVDQINALTDNTGVVAEVVGGTDIDLTTAEFGASQTFSFTELADAGNVVFGAGAATGTDATATLTVDGNAVADPNFDGRTLSFTNLGGASGTIELFENTTIFPENAAAGVVNITIHNGGKALIDESGNLISRVAFSAFDFGTLGDSQGGLDAIDLAGDAAGALSIIAAAKDDITASISSASSVADGFLASRIETNADQIGNLNTSLDEVQTFAEAIQLFDRVRYESQLNTSLGLLSQLSSLFPLSAFGAL